jgi:hypothetical protein
MAKANRRSRYSDSKGRPRANLRDPEVRRLVRDGKISISSSIKRVLETRANGADYSRDAMVKHYAFMETLLYYFDDEWFDLDKLLQDNLIKGMTSNTNFNSGSMSIPRRCSKCRRAYHEYRDRAELYIEYLAKDVFGNVPMEKEDCLECRNQNAQPVAAQ